jgi:hypothetical protein
VNAMTCAALREIAGELALDMLGGEERATALAHLETCPECRHEVALLTDAAEELLVLAPDIDPPDGFDQRVVARIEALTLDSPVPTTSGTPARRRIVVRRAFALVAAVAIVLGGVLIVQRRGTHDPATRTADMRAAAGQIVGHVALVADPDSIVVTIPDWTGLVKSYGATVDSPYWLAVESDDGSHSMHRLPRGDGNPWHIAVATAPRRITTVSVVDDKGTVWCSAQLTR